MKVSGKSMVYFSLEKFTKLSFLRERGCANNLTYTLRFVDCVVTYRSSTYLASPMAKNKEKCQHCKLKIFFTHLSLSYFWRKGPQNTDSDSPKEIMKFHKWYNDGPVSL